MRPELRILPGSEEIAREGAKEFALAARDAVVERGFFTVALAGGSTPRRMYELIAEQALGRAGIPWESVHFFFGDERTVPPEHVDSNYRMVREALLDHIPVPTENVHRIQGDHPDPESAAALYEFDLRGFFVTRTALLGMFPRFDLVFLGLGADAHTASVFPGTTVIFEQHHWVKDVFVEKFGQVRITLTPPVLNAARRVFFLVSGGDKAAAVEAVLESESDPGRFPAQIIRPREGLLTWLVDRAAASKLSR